MQSVIFLAVFLLLASSCSCSREMPWSTFDYSLENTATFDSLENTETFDYSLENTDYSSVFGNDFHAKGASSFSVMNYGAAGNGQTDDSQVIFFSFCFYYSFLNNVKEKTMLIEPSQV